MKLTNEKIEEIINRIKKSGFADIQTEHIESMCTEIFEFRRLSEVSGVSELHKTISKLEQRIKELENGELRKN